MMEIVSAVPHRRSSRRCRARRPHPFPFSWCLWWLHGVGPLNTHLRCAVRLPCRDSAFSATRSVPGCALQSIHVQGCAAWAPLRRNTFVEIGEYRPCPRGLPQDAQAQRWRYLGPRSPLDAVDRAVHFWSPAHHGPPRDSPSGLVHIRLQIHGKQLALDRVTVPQSSVVTIWPGKRPIEVRGVKSRMVSHSA